MTSSISTHTMSFVNIEKRRAKEKQREEKEDKIIFWFPFSFLSLQSSTMGKHRLLKQNCSHPSKVRIRSEFVFLNPSASDLAMKSSSFRPLATSTPNVFKQSNSWINKSKDDLFIPPAYSSTPKAADRRKRIVISQRRLHYCRSLSRKDSDQMQKFLVKPLKIWLL